MKDLIEQLGINWKLLVSQAVNFLILLFVLKTFIYKPVLDIIEKRKKKIDEGLAMTQEASLRLKDIDDIGKNKIKKAEQESISMIEDAEKRAKSLEQEMVKKAEDHQKELMEKAESIFQKEREEAKDIVFKEAAELVKRAILKTVELDPDKIDEALIKKAVLSIKENN